AQAPEQEQAGKFNTLQRLSFFLVSLPAFLRGLYWRAIRKHPRLFKRGGGTVAMTAVGMFGNGAGWRIAIAYHTLTLTLVGVGEQPRMKCIDLCRVTTSCLIRCWKRPMPSPSMLLLRLSGLGWYRWAMTVAGGIPTRAGTAGLRRLSGRRSLIRAPTGSSRNS